MCRMEWLSSRRVSPLCTLTCPGCSARVDRVISLFLGGDAAESSNGLAGETEIEGSVINQMDAVFKAQQDNLCVLHSMCEEKKRKEELIRKCALLHHEQLEVSRKLEECAARLPLISSTNPTEGSRGSAASAAITLDKYSADALQLYLSHTAPVLFSTEKDLRQARVENRRRKKKIDKLHMQQERLKKRLGEYLGAAHQSFKDIKALKMKEIEEEKLRVQKKLELRCSYPKLPSAKSPPVVYHESGNSSNGIELVIDDALHPLEGTTLSKKSFFPEQWKETSISADVSEDFRLWKEDKERKNFIDVVDEISIYGANEVVTVDDDETNNEGGTDHSPQHSNSALQFFDVESDDGDTNKDDSIQEQLDETLFLPPFSAHRMPSETATLAKVVRALPRREDYLWQTTLV